MREIGVGPNKIHGLSRARAAPPRPADDWLRFCPGGSASGRLQLDETREGALCGHQLVVGAGFDDAAVLHHDDAVRVGDGREPVRDDEARATRAQSAHGLGDVLLGLAVERARRLIHDEDRRVAQERSGDRDALLLTAREEAAAVARAGRRRWGFAGCRA